MADNMLITRDANVVRVSLNRPDVRNALDQPTITALTKTFAELAHDESIRVIVLSGEGAAFCGGADINYMQASLGWSEEENESDALRLSGMFRAVDDCPAPVIARIHGACLGAGAGLASVCDVAIAADDTIFGFTEVKLGIVPAVISPFVLRKIGQSHARALFVCGERFDAQRAMRIGLVHDAAPAADLDAAVQKKIDEVLSSGPHAARVAKHIAKTVTTLAPHDVQTWTARRIAERRASDEGQEGLRAFIEKRKPSWR